MTAILRLGWAVFSCFTVGTAVVEEVEGPGAEVLGPLEVLGVALDVLVS